jgi:hypothetical protein
MIKKKLVTVRIDLELLGRIEIIQEKLFPFHTSKSHIINSALSLGLNELEKEVSKLKVVVRKGNSSA